MESIREVRSVTRLSTFWTSFRTSTNLTPRDKLPRSIGRSFTPIVPDTKDLALDPLAQIQSTNKYQLKAMRVLKLTLHTSQTSNQELQIHPVQVARSTSQTTITSTIIMDPTSQLYLMKMLRLLKNTRMHSKHQEPSVTFRQLWVMYPQLLQVLNMFLRLAR